MHFSARDLELLSASILTDIAVHSSCLFASGQLNEAKTLLERVVRLVRSLRIKSAKLRLYIIDMVERRKHYNTPRAIGQVIAMAACRLPSMSRRERAPAQKVKQDTFALLFYLYGTGCTVVQQGAVGCHVSSRDARA